MARLQQTDHRSREKQKQSSLPQNLPNKQRMRLVLTISRNGMVTQLGIALTSANLSAKSNTCSTTWSNSGLKWLLSKESNQK